MVSKDTKDIFSEHMIAQTIRADIQKIKSSAEMQSFARGLKYKSEKTKQTDLDLVNMLMIKLEQYAEGWITANASKTGELWRKSQAFDRQVGMAEAEINTFIKELDILTQRIRK